MLHMGRLNVIERGFFSVRRFIDNINRIKKPRDLLMEIHKIISNFILKNRGNIYNKIIKRSVFKIHESSK